MNIIRDICDKYELCFVLHTSPIPEAHHALVYPLSPGDRHAEGDAAGERQGRLGNNSVTAGALSS